MGGTVGRGAGGAGERHRGADTAASADAEAGLIRYTDPASGQAVEQSVLGGGGKLQWKVDWAMRWHALGVDYEMSGKDLIDSVKLSSRIVRVLGSDPPAGFNYELF